jgi:hypothetical protein
VSTTRLATRRPCIAESPLSTVLLLNLQTAVRVAGDRLRQIQHRPAEEVAVGQTVVFGTLSFRDSGAFQRAAGGKGAGRRSVWLTRRTERLSRRSKRSSWTRRQHPRDRWQRQLRLQRVVGHRCRSAPTAYPADLSQLCQAPRRPAGICEADHKADRPLPRSSDPRQELASSVQQRENVASVSDGKDGVPAGRRWADIDRKQRRRAW